MYIKILLDIDARGCYLAPMMKIPQKRYLAPFIEPDLGDKIVFIGGPRQVGKTTLALNFLKDGSKTHPAYRNWDVPAHRSALLKSEIPANEQLIILDEMHKHPRWRNLLKGFYDQYVPEKSFIVTGSARLDYYRKGGDSLLGRYFYYRLHPLTISELSRKGTASDVKDLMALGGFPEPFLKGSTRFWARWNRTRIEQILSEDLRDLERVYDIGLIELLVDSLPERISSPLSLNNLAWELGVSQDSVKRWMAILERLYFCYDVMPYGEPKIKAVKKEKKNYFWDWAFAPEGGARFENMVAGHLLKYCHFKEDTEGFKMELRYIRDVNGREVDFVVLQGKQPLFAVECKLSEREVSPAIIYFAERTKIPVFYQVHLDSADYETSRSKKKIRVLPFWRLGDELGLV